MSMTGITDWVLRANAQQQTVNAAKQTHGRLIAEAIARILLRIADAILMQCLHDVG